MANLSKVIYINEEDYSTLLNGGTITKGGVTYSHDPTALYVIKNVSAPEYAETAGYATTAGQATKATQDGGGNVISETYAKKSDAAEAIHLTGTLSDGYWTFEDINGNTLTDAEMIALLEDPNKLISIYYNGFSDGTRTYEATVFRPIGSDSITFTNFDGNRKRYFYISLDWIDDRVYDDEHGMDDSLESRQKEIITLGGTNNAPTFTDCEGSPLTHFEFKTQYLDGFKKDVILKVQISTDVYHYYQLFKSEKQASTLTNYRFISFPNTTTVECVELLYNSSNNTFQRGGSNASLQTLINSGNKLSADYIQDGTNNKVFSAADKTKLDGIEAATASPLMDGNVDVGSSTKYAKEDHVHPSDTSKANVADLATVATSGSYNDLTDKPTASDIGAITRFVVDFTLSGTTISNPNKTFLEIKAAYDAGNLVLARDNTDGLYYLLYCEATGCGFFCSDSGTLYTIDVDSSDTWTYQETNISQLELELSDKSQIIYIQKINNDWRKVTYNNVTGTWSVNNTVLTTGNTKNIYLDKDNNDLYYWDGSEFVLIDEDNVQPDWNQSDSSKADYIKNKPVIPNSIKVGSVAGKLYRNDVNGGGNFTVKGNSGCIPNIIAGTFLVSIYAKSTTQSYTFKFNFGSVSYNLSTTNGEINDTREITIPSDGTFSGSVLNGSVAPGTILYVVMYDYLTPVSTVGVAAVTNRYSDLDGTPNIPTVNNGTLTIQQNGITVSTFTANQSSNTTANIYSTIFGIKGQTGFERDTYNSSNGTWSGVEIVTPDPLVTYIDISNNKLYRYDPITTNYVDLGGSGNLTSTAITNLTDIL